MAKKKDITNLISGILGNSQPSGKEPLDKEVVKELGITPDLEEKLNQVRREKVGRPKGTGRKDKNQEPETRATFVVNPDIVLKVKYIALMDSRLLKDVISEALTSYIDEWESNNQVIKLPKKK